MKFFSSVKSGFKSIIKEIKKQHQDSLDSYIKRVRLVDDILTIDSQKAEPFVKKVQDIEDIDIWTYDKYSVFISYGPKRITAFGRPAWRRKEFFITTKDEKLKNDILGLFEKLKTKVDRQNDVKKYERLKEECEQLKKKIEGHKDET